MPTPACECPSLPPAPVAAVVTPTGSCVLPTRYGDYRMEAFEVEGSELEVTALVSGDPVSCQPALVRLHSECLTGDAFGSLRCDCGEQLAAALSMIQCEGCGILLYLRQEGRGIGLLNKVRAYALQDAGLDTVDANLALGLPVDGREYDSSAAVLDHMGVRDIRLLTNNPDKVRELIRNGINVVERVPIEMPPHRTNISYLRTKAERLGHAFDTLSPGWQEIE